MKIKKVFSIIYQILYAIGQLVWAIKKILEILDDSADDEKEKS